MSCILLAIIGSSPQVLTETLYGIYKSGKPYPQKVIVVTTKSCKSKLEAGLFINNKLAQLEQEYSLPSLNSNDIDIQIITDKHGNEIFDAKSIEDQATMANFITGKVYELTEDEGNSIHASIAGGRKTMAFYLGYAMSLFGRSQDTLSHVFVNDEFEFNDEFWFPTISSNEIPNNKKKEEILNTRDAVITLAEIPFVRMRQLVPKQLIQSLQNTSFSKTVDTYNSIESNSLSIKFNFKARRLLISGILVKLTAKECAFYAWLARKGAKGLVIDRYFEDEVSYSEEFLELFEVLSNDNRVYSTFGLTPEDFKERLTSSLKPMDRQFVQTCRTNLNRKLFSLFPPNIAEKISINSIQVSGKQSTVYFLTNDVCDALLEGSS
ncbi:CRISPR-associated ring nuclease Csm6 [Parashewanella tropica]|uniref:CRISPR-associated ring nuclease Csm6 n=1 Tax=Parashewanella tropica TaxID=2547970 RepID=UPI00105988C2|nr:CRISPR-associated ring nuclease Csm6 [Parashewanella tropica]